MRLVLQRVSRAAVRVGGEQVASIGRGLLVLVGVGHRDGAREVEAAARKLTQLRLFDDAQGRMNVGLMEAGAAFLVVSQFTLMGSLRRGRRPSFDGAAPAAHAEPLVAELVEELRRSGFEAAAGLFGARMEVELVNEGPVTFVLDV